MFSITTAVSGYLLPKIGYLLKAISGILMILGLVLWAVFDEDKLIIQSVLYGKRWVERKNGLWIAGFVINFVFNFLFSRLIACNLVGALTAKMFFDFEEVHYFDPNDKTFVGSKLHALDLWGFKEKQNKGPCCCCRKF